MSFWDVRWAFERRVVGDQGNKAKAHEKAKTDGKRGRMQFGLTIG